MKYPAVVGGLVLAALVVTGTGFAEPISKISSLSPRYNASEIEITWETPLNRRLHNVESCSDERRGSESSIPYRLSLSGFCGKRERGSTFWWRLCNRGHQLDPDRKAREVTRAPRLCSYVKRRPRERSALPS